MSGPRIGGVIVAWNAEEDLPALLASLREQTCGLARLTLIDNGSSDRTVEIAESRYPGIKTVRNGKNLGFARGTNIGLEMVMEDCELVLTINQDIILEKDCLEKLAEAAERHPEAASFQPLLFRMASKGDQDPIVDSSGHLMYRDRVAVNRGAGKRRSEVETGGPLFGVSAALALYRSDALRGVSPDGEVFCSDFFSYFEDVDLDYRLLLAGWEPRFCPEAVAWHAHAGSGLRRRPMIRMHGAKNRWLLMYRHESLNSLAGCWGAVIRQDLFSLAKALLTDLPALAGPVLALWYLPRALSWRKRFRPLRRLTPEDLRERMLAARPPGKRS
jgi:GT2 family glycosyltransferase